MNRPKSLGLTVLAIWLILTGLLPFLRVSLPYEGVIVPVMAVIAGVLILMER